MTLGNSIKKILVTSEEILSAIGGDIPDQTYIRKLKPIVKKLAEHHREHELFLVCDIGDLPWDPEQPNFVEWLQIPGAFNSGNYLPRNLVDVFGLNAWPDVFPDEIAESFSLVLLTEEELAAVRAEFEKRIKQIEKGNNGS